MSVRKFVASMAGKKELFLLVAPLALREFESEVAPALRFMTLSLCPRTVKSPPAPRPLYPYHNVTTHSSLELLLFSTLIQRFGSEQIWERRAHHFQHHDEGYFEDLMPFEVCLGTPPAAQHRGRESS